MLSLQPTPVAMVTKFSHAATKARVLSSYLRVQDTARDLGVVIDSQLSLSTHVAAVCRSGHYQLRQLLAYRYASASISRLLHLFIGRCPEILRHT